MILTLISTIIINITIILSMDMYSLEGFSTSLISIVASILLFGILASIKELKLEQKKNLELQSRIN